MRRYVESCHCLWLLNFSGVDGERHGFKGLCTAICRLIFTSAKKVMFTSAFVCLFAGYQDYTQTTQPVFTKFGGKVTHGPRKNPLDFGGNLYVRVSAGKCYG